MLGRKLEIREYHDNNQGHMLRHFYCLHVGFFSVNLGIVFSNNKPKRPLYIPCALTQNAFHHPTKTECVYACPCFNVSILSWPIGVCTKWLHFTGDFFSSAFSSMKNYCVLKFTFHWGLFLKVQLTISHEFAPNRWQAITWTKVDASPVSSYDCVVSASVATTKCASWKLLL